MKTLIIHTVRPRHTANFCEKNLLEHFVIHLSVLSLLSDSGEMSDLWIKQLCTQHFGANESHAIFAYRIAASKKKNWCVLLIDALNQMR